jgi:hypothetical protein
MIKRRNAKGPRHRGNFYISGIEDLVAFNFFTSPELKAQVSFSDHPLSGVRLSVHL